MQHQNLVLISILFAHFAGDFPLQTNRIVKAKQKNYLGYIAHGGVHYLVLISSLRVFANSWFFSWKQQALIAVYVALHLLIDFLKQFLTKRDIIADGVMAFSIDQLLHIGTIVGFWSFLTQSPAADLFKTLQIDQGIKEKAAVIGLIYLVGVFASGYLIRYLTRSLTRKTTTQSETPEELQNAGLYIGWIERVLIITAILMKSPEMVGLILTGKSIARFPEFKDPHFAEYYLIGTFLSIGTAVGFGIILLKFVYGTIVFP